MAENTDVVVIGGGYAGVMAADRLTQRDDVTVTLINPRQTFVRRLRLPQLVGGFHDAVTDYREVLARGVLLVVYTAIRIDATERSVTLATGGTVGYDYLIYAVGSGSADPQVPGAAEFAYPIATLEAAAAAGPRRRARNGPGDRCRSGRDRHRDGRRSGGAWSHCDPGLRRGARPIPAPAGPTLGRLQHQLNSSQVGVSTTG